MSKKVKICINCRHYTAPTGVHHYRDGTCGHKDAFMGVDIITGARKERTCVYMREGPGSCGKEGANYSEKPDAQLGVHEKDNG